MNRRVVFLLGAALVALVVILVLVVNTEPPTPDEESERGHAEEHDAPGVTGPSAESSAEAEASPDSDRPDGPPLIVAATTQRRRHG